MLICPHLYPHYVQIVNVYYRTVPDILHGKNKDLWLYVGCYLTLKNGGVNSVLGLISEEYLVLFQGDIIRACLIPLKQSSYYL